MRRFILFLFLLLFTIMWVKGNPNFNVETLKQTQNWSDEETGFGPLTAEQARQAIINWAGRDNLSINLLPYDDSDWFLAHYPLAEPRVIEGVTAHKYPAFYYQLYVFKVLDPNPDHKYSGFIRVNSWTGAIYGIYKRDFVPNRERTLLEGGSIANMVPPQQAVNLAKRYLASYFSALPTETFQEVDFDPAGAFPNSDETSWLSYAPNIIVFLKTTDTHPGSVIGIARVTLDSYTGNLINLECVYEDLEISLIPDISTEEAVEASVSFLYAIGAEHIEFEYVGDSYWCKEAPNGRQMFVLPVYFSNTWARQDSSDGVKKLLGSGRSLTRVCVGVDAHTGEVIFARNMGLAGGPVKRFSTPCLFLNGEKQKTREVLLIKGKFAFISLEDIKKFGFVFRSFGKENFIVFKEEKAPVDVKLIIKRREKLYLNVEVLNKFEKVRAYYNPKFNTIDIVIMNLKAYEQAKKLLKKYKIGLLHPDIKWGALGGSLSLSALGYALWKFLKLLG